MNPIVKKIQKLLALAKNQAGRPEGETAAKMAHKLMTAHAVTMADLSFEEQQELDPLIHDPMEAKSGVWRRTLLYTIARHCNCRSAYRTGDSAKYCSDNKSGKARQIFYFYGHQSDVEVAQYLYDVCERQIAAACKDYLAGLSKYWYESGDRRSLANDFKRSAVDGLATKLVDMRMQEKREQTSETNAIVLSRFRKVDNWVDSNFEFGAGRSNADYRHNIDGYNAGKRVDIRAGVTKKQRRLKG